MPETPDQSGEAREFASVLLDIRGAHEDATEAMAKLTAAVHETGIGGSITLKIELKPVSKGDGTQVTASHTVATKMPKVSSRPTILFTTADGLATRDDPTQQTLPLAVAAPRPALPMREDRS